jgi:perosamine synthetase
MGDEEIKEVGEVIKSGWIGLGPKTAEFEKKFADFIGTKYAVGVNSCTAALHLAIMGLGINSGEVITTPMTFVSTSHAILYNNAIPVFADIERDTLNINVTEIEKKITDRTKAILLVHYGGHPCEMDEILDLAERHNLYVIEDCAHACGAKYKGVQAGSMGDAGCFSFHAVKNLATGDGGMITTDNKDLYDRLQKLRWVGITKDTYQRSKREYSWYYEVEELGYKYHMNDITAAIGLVQLNKLEIMNQRRREIAQTYNKQLGKLYWIELPIERNYVKSAFHNYVVKMEDRDAFMNHMTVKGISTGVHYMPVHLHPLYKKLGIRANVPVAEEVWKKLVTLPLYPDMMDSDVDFVVNSIKEFGENYK